jgi:cytochrome c oxidase cbb3-type subunit 3
MKRFVIASVFAAGIGFFVSQAVRTPIYAASGFQANTQTNQQTNQNQQQSGQAASPVKGETAAVGTSSHPDLSKAGGDLFVQNCAFCHGRDAMGGETGPDLTRSKLVIADVGGDKISEVIRDGRPQKGMPSFNFSNEEMLSVVAFIHDQEKKAAAQNGRRRGVDVSDLQTGNVEKGKEYFNGAGGCSKCHSPTGDLAGIASRYEGLHLEERMLYPRDAKSKVTVTLPSGEKVSGTLAYQDEFVIGLRDANNTYRSWPTSKVKYAVDAPVEAHVELFPKYTDDDIHNLMAYLQTLR